MPLVWQAQQGNREALVQPETLVRPVPKGTMVTLELKVQQVRKGRQVQSGLRDKMET